MTYKKIFFVGLGGAGQRHLRIFKELLGDDVEYSAYRSKGKTPLLNKDFSVNTDVPFEEYYGLKLFKSLEEGLDNNPDLIVISTPSSLHFDVALEAAKRGIHIFVEKPFSHNLNGYDEFEQTVIKNNLNFFVSYNRRFHKYLRKIKEVVASGQLGKIVTANFNVGSYVPHWHPYEDFRELYACKKELGGGVLLTEIHELDLCYWYFGYPQTVNCRGGNYSEFKLDVEDTVFVTLKYEDFAADVNLCFMQEQTQRHIFIGGEKGSIEWNVGGNKLTIVDKVANTKEELSDPEYSNDAMFYSQASYFLNEFTNSDATYIDAAKAGLVLVESSKKSMELGREINLDDEGYGIKRENQHTGTVSA